MAKLRELQPEKFEKRRLARDLHAALAGRLSRAKSAVRTLTEFVECSDDRPCGLEACPICTRRFRRGLMRETHSLGLDQQTWTSASIFPADWQAAEGDLASVDLGRFAKQATDWLENCDVRRRSVIGGIDVVNVFNEGSPWPSIWQVQVHLMLQGALDAGAASALASAFPAPGEGRNVVLREIKPELFHNALTACYKSRFSRRVFSFAERTSPFVAPRRRHRDTALPLKQQLELAEWLLALPVGSRLILRNLHRVNRTDSKLRLELSPEVA